MVTAPLLRSLVSGCPHGADRRARGLCLVQELAINGTKIMLLDSVYLVVRADTDRYDGIFFEDQLDGDPVALVDVNSVEIGQSSR